MMQHPSQQIVPRRRLTMVLLMGAFLLPPGGAVQGQSSESSPGPGAVSVRGTSTLGALIEPGDTTLVSGVLRTRGPVWQSGGLIYPGRPPSGAPAGPIEPAIPRLPAPLALR